MFCSVMLNGSTGVSIGAGRNTSVDADGDAGGDAKAEIQAEMLA